MSWIVDATINSVSILTLITVIVIVYYNHKQYGQMERQIVIQNDQLKTQNEQIKNNFFAEYTKRFQEIALHFPLDIYEDTFSYDVLDEKTRDEVLRYIKIYFDLCYEEWFLNENKKIDKKVWGDWKDGICFAFSKHAFKEAWDKFYVDSDFYKDFKKYVESELSKNERNIG